MADHHLKGWDDHVRKALARLAATVLQATQDHVKALAIARTLGSNAEAADNDAFLAATWRVLQAERQCDALLRDARRVILGAVQDAPSLMLANDLAATMEQVGETTLREGEIITLDGNEGVFYGGAARVEVSYPEELLARLDALRKRAARI